VFLFYCIIVYILFIMVSGKSSCASLAPCYAMDEKSSWQNIGGSCLMVNGSSAVVEVLLEAVGVGFIIHSLYYMIPYELYENSTRTLRELYKNFEMFTEILFVLLT